MINRKKCLLSGIICVCWIAGTLVGFLPLFGWNAGETSDHRCIFTKVMDYDYLVFLYFATIIFPALLIAAFYAHIYRVIVKQVSHTKETECRHGKQRYGEIAKKCNGYDGCSYSKSSRWTPAEVVPFAVSEVYVSAGAIKLRGRCCVCSARRANGRSRLRRISRVSSSSSSSAGFLCTR